MSEKWPTKEQKNTKLRGIAKVLVQPNGIVRMVFKANPEDIYEFEPQDAPENIRQGTWFVTLSGNGEKMYSFSPVAGIEKAKFVRISAAKDTPPMPREYQYEWKDEKTGKIVPIKYMAFTALHEIIEGKNAGLQFAIFLRYYFTDSGDGKVAFTKLKSHHTAFLISWCEATGAFERGVMPFTENILPALEKRLKQAATTQIVVFKDGNVDSIAPGSSSEEDEDEEVGVDLSVAPAKNKVQPEQLGLFSEGDNEAPF